MGLAPVVSPPQGAGNEPKEIQSTQLNSNQSSGSVSEESRICRICASVALTLVGSI
jgi:hypothetical protein